MNVTKIYLVTNCYGDPNKVYIGKNSGSQTRRYAHTYKYGKQITYDYIDQVESLYKKDWKPLEGFWIRYFKFLGFIVLNGNEGGGGNIFHTQEAKDQISNSMKGKKHNNHVKGIDHGKTGKRDSPETILNKKKPKPEGFGKQISKIKLSLNIKLTKEHRINIGKAQEKPTSQFTLDGKFLKEFKSSKEAAQHIGVHEVNMRAHLGGKYKTCKGFIFKYK